MRCAPARRVLPDVSIIIAAMAAAIKPRNIRKTWTQKNGPPRSVPVGQQFVVDSELLLFRGGVALHVHSFVLAVPRLTSHLASIAPRLAPLVTSVAPRLASLMATSAPRLTPALAGRSLSRRC